MSKLDDIQYVLSSDFFAPDKNKFLERQSSFIMEVPIKNDGLPYLSYKYDKNLKGYKGGLFPFLAQNKGVQRISDYVIFAEKGSQLYILVVELKKGKENTIKQLDAAKHFVEYIVKTTIRVKQNSISPQIRCISISDNKRIRKGTMEKPVQYQDNYAEFKGKVFRLKTFLT
jgi:hypothetical protein